LTVVPVNQELGKVEINALYLFRSGLVKVSTLGTLLTDGDLTKHMGDFLDFYDDQINKFNALLSTLDEQLEKIDDELRLVQRRMDNAGVWVIVQNVPAVAKSIYNLMLIQIKTR